MAEALALVGLASSIVQFVAFSATVIDRLRDFQQRVGEVPKAFQAITIELPLLLKALEQTNKQPTAINGSQELKPILNNIVQDCHAQIELLNEILDKTLPDPSDDSLRRGRKAFRSLRQEGKVKQIKKTLSKHIQLLTYYHTSGLPVLQAGSDIAVTKAHFLIPFVRDECFINRGEIIEEIQQKFGTQRRVALAGIGGVG